MSKYACNTERVVGFEMEYSPSVYILESSGSQKSRSILETPIQGIEDIIASKFGSVSSGFLGNAFKSYIDGDLNELCTPECYPDKIGVVQLASEAIMEDSLSVFISQNEHSYGKLDYLLPLRVSGETRSSGYHENYQVLCYDTKDIVPFLIGYAATQSVWSGQGEYIAKSGTYQIAQKVNSDIRGSDSAVCIKDSGDLETETFFKRFEFRRQNYPISYWQLKNRAAFTSAVIRLVDSGQIDSTYTVYGSQTENYKKISNNPDEKLDLYSGKKYTSAEYQLMLAEKVISVGKKYNFPEYEVDAAQEVAEVCENLISGNRSLVANEVPWIRKLQIIESIAPRSLENTVSDDDSLLAKSLCIACDSLGYGGLTEVIRKRQTKDRISSEAVNSAITDPPCIPIAKLRALNIRDNHNNDKSYWAYWMSATLTSH